MSELKDLLKFVTSVNKNDPGVMDTITGKSNSLKLTKFSEVSRNPLFKDENEIKKALYGRKRKTDGYRKLKSRFKNKLIDSIFLSNTGRRLKFPYDNSLFNVQRNLFAAQILLLQDQRKSAIALTVPALHAAIRFQHSHLAVIACRILCHHSALSGSGREFKNYSEILVQKQKLFLAELEIQKLYNAILFKIVKAADYDSQSKKLLRKSYDKASRINRSNRSHVIVLHYYRIAIRYFQSQHLYNKAISLCKECNQYLEKNPHLYQRSRAGEFALYEMESCLRLQQYEKGMACAERCMRHFTPYHSPWLVFNEQYFLLAMRTGNYFKALDIFYIVTSSYRFKKLAQVKIELWKIYEAWLNFSLPDSLPKKQFNLFRFLNEVETVRKDKSGYNFSIIIAQLLLLINIQEKEKLFELEAAFRLYLNRHIKKETNPRNYYFGMMMRILYNSDFNSKSAEKKARPFCKKLESMNKTLPTLEETEIIPYPMLWKLILEKCKQMK